MRESTEAELDAEIARLEIEVSRKRKVMRVAELRREIAEIEELAYPNYNRCPCWLCEYGPHYAGGDVTFG